VYTEHFRQQVWSIIRIMWNTQQEQPPEKTTATTRKQ